MEIKKKTQNRQERDYKKTRENIFCITYNLKFGAFVFRTVRLFSYKGIYNFSSKDL